jgi:hypothetical protein
MAKLIIKVDGKPCADYINGLIASACRTRGISLSVAPTDSQLTIIGRTQDVTFMKKIIEAHLTNLSEIQEKIGDMLAAVEKAKITKE